MSELMICFYRRHFLSKKPIFFLSRPHTIYIWESYFKFDKRFMRALFGQGSGLWELFLNMCFRTWQQTGSRYACISTHIKIYLRPYQKRDRLFWSKVQSTKAYESIAFCAYIYIYMYIYARRALLYPPPSSNLMICYVMFFYVMLCYVMICYDTIYYVMLCFVTLYYALRICNDMLCYVMLG